ncbi:MAG: serine/threonine-protein kinase [Planctomycetota bacterium]|jgi:HEAT repeat protein
MPPHRLQANKRREKLGDAVRGAAAHQRLLFERAGLWVRLGRVLLAKAEIPDEDLLLLQGTALLPTPKGADADLLGGVALKLGIIEPEALIEAALMQIEARVAGQPHPLVASCLRQQGEFSDRDQAICERLIPQEAKLLRDEHRRLASQPKGKTPMTPACARYVLAAKSGEFNANQVLMAHRRAESLRKNFGEPVLLWEALLLRGVVTPEHHLKVLKVVERVTIRGSAGHEWMLGGVLLELGYTTSADLERALAIQTGKKSAGSEPPRLGELLKQQGVLTVAELQEALRLQRHRRIGSPQAHAADLRSRKAWLLGAALLVSLAVLALLGTPIALTLWHKRTVRDSTAPRADRVAALAWLEQSGSDRSLRAIENVYGDVQIDPALRSDAFRALLARGRLGQGEATGALEDPAPSVRAAALWWFGTQGLAAKGPQPGVTETIASLATQDPDPAVRLAASRADLLRGPSARAREAVVSGLGEGSAARQALTKAVREPVIPGLVAALEKASGFRIGNDPGRWETWLDLQPIADEILGSPRSGAEHRFRKLLTADNLGLRFVAARALAHQGDGAGLPLLVRALDTKETALRAALDQRGLDAFGMRHEIAALLWLHTGQNLGPDASAWHAWFDRGP